MLELHRPVERIVPGARDAVLFIHGFLGTPRFWQPFLDALPEDVSFLALLLPGHGGKVPEFGHVPRGAWRSAADQAIRELSARHERVYIVAHSLGTLLAVSSVVRDPGRVKGMLLIAVPLHLRISPRTLLSNIRKGLGLGESGAALSSYYGTDPDWRVWRYLSWLPRYLEFFSESAAARRALPQLRIPSQAFMFRRDELVSPRSIAPLKNSPSLRVTVLPDSGHHAFTEDERSRMLAACLHLIGE